MNEPTKQDAGRITDRENVEKLLQDAKQACIPHAQAVTQLRDTLRALKELEADAITLRQAVEAQFLSVSGIDEAVYNTRGGRHE